MFCKDCGKMLPEGADICPNCGKAQSESPVQIVQRQDAAEPSVQIVQRQDAAADPSDRPSFGYAFLGFLLPVIGLILYLVWKDDTPLRARSCGRGAAVGFVIYFLLVLVCIILVIVGLFAFSEAMREGTRMALSALSFMGV